MADSYVCSGAMMKCTMGSSPARLTVLPTRTVFLAGQPQANISDHKSMVNLAPFGVCRSLAFPPTAAATAAAHGHLTPMPCVHNTPAPWFVGKMDTLIKGQPALLQSCKCQCMWGGTISLINNGQVAIGAQGVNKAKHPQNSLGDFGANSSDISNDTTEASNSEQTTRKASALDVAKMGPWIKSLNEQQKGEVKRLMGLVPDGSNLDKLVKVYNMMQIAPNNMSFQDKTQFAQNYIELEKKLNIQKGDKMSVANADKQNANPKYEYKYITDPNGELVINGTRVRENPNYDVQYTINCATCSAAYALRLMGFDVKAKGNVEGTLNNEVSIHPFDMWNNLDGSKANQVSTEQWMRDNNVESMTVNDYKKFFDETCAEEGVYTIALRWNGGGGHATILQRDKDGTLYYIEPQVYQSNATTDGRRSIDDLLMSPNGQLKLTSNPRGEEGILRVDDKNFNPDYATLFET